MKNSAKKHSGRDFLETSRKIIDILGDSLLEERENHGIAPAMIISFDDPSGHFRELQMIFRSKEDIQRIDEISTLTGFALAIGSVRGGLPLVKCVTNIAETVCVEHDSTIDEEIPSTGVVAVSVFDDGKVIVDSRLLKEQWDETSGVKEIVKKETLEDTDGKTMGEGPISAFWMAYKMSAEIFKSAPEEKKELLDELARDVLTTIVDSPIANPALNHIGHDVQ